MRELPRLLAIALLAAMSESDTHAGGLNREGCHNNRKTGDDHCHRGGGSSRPSSSALGMSLAPQRAGPSGETGYFASCSAARPRHCRSTGQKKHARGQSGAYATKGIGRLL